MVALTTKQVMVADDMSEPVEGVPPPPRELETAELMNEPQLD